ncbi:inosine triphosphate pyrophosphatase-like protein [Entophlyctis helioformis]|nr:inosine triphosphate pyrophosphatase-like protein [Entophlyctis helioformis]
MATSLSWSLTDRLRRRAVVLASTSPRRRDLLSRLGIDFAVVPSTFPETLDKSTFASPADYVQTNAREKALEVYTRLKVVAYLDTDTANLLVVGSDTIVVLGNQILEKPVDTADAKRLLRSLSAREHVVMTAVVVIAAPAGGAATDGEPAVTTLMEETRVVFGRLTEEMIDAYVASGEPMDKAGGYGYQALAALFIERIQGCYYNCVGFPLYRVVQALETMDL